MDLLFSRMNNGDHLIYKGSCKVGEKRQPNVLNWCSFHFVISQESNLCILTATYLKQESQSSFPFAIRSIFIVIRVHLRFRGRETDWIGKVEMKKLRGVSYLGPTPHQSKKPCLFSLKFSFGESMRLKKMLVFHSLLQCRPVSVSRSRWLVLVRIGIWKRGLLFSISGRSLPFHFVFRKRIRGDDLSITVRIPDA